MAGTRQTQTGSHPAAASASSELDTILQRADQAAVTAAGGNDPYGNAQHQALALYAQAGKMRDRRGAVGVCRMEALNAANLQQRWHTAPGRTEPIDVCANRYMAAWEAERRQLAAAQATPAHAAPTGPFKVFCISIGSQGFDWKGNPTPPTIIDDYSVAFDPDHKVVTMSRDPFTVYSFANFARVLASGDSPANLYKGSPNPRQFRDGHEEAYSGPLDQGDGAHEGVEFTRDGVNFYQQRYHYGSPTVRSGGVYRYASQSIELSGDGVNGSDQCAYTRAEAIARAQAEQ